jgi:hypothetical protein
VIVPILIPDYTRYVLEFLLIATRKHKKGNIEELFMYFSDARTRGYEHTIILSVHNCTLFVMLFMPTPLLTRHDSNY